MIFAHLFCNIGIIYISDENNNRIRKVELTGIISTIVGKDFGNYLSGDNGDATSATVSSPKEIAVDSAGIFINTIFFIFHTHLCNSRQRIYR